MARSEPGKQYRKEKRLKEIKRLRKRAAKKKRLRTHREERKENG